MEGIALWLGPCPRFQQAVPTGLEQHPDMSCACCPRRHNFHLQCVMQWAQRSRECPMCFKSLQLKVRSRLPEGRTRLLAHPGGCFSAAQLLCSVVCTAINPHGAGRRPERAAPLRRVRGSRMHAPRVTSIAGWHGCLGAGTAACTHCSLQHSAAPRATEGWKPDYYSPAAHQPGRRRHQSRAIGHTRRTGAR